MDNKVKEFFLEREAEIKLMSQDQELFQKALDVEIHACKYKYTYNSVWMGRPIIKQPFDLVAAQELIWQIKPDLIIETGIAHGGSLIFAASMLELIGGDGMVVGVDIDIREHNRREIEKHPMNKRITMLEGSSTDDNIMTELRELAKGKKCVMVMLDSLHTHDHVLKEMELYSPLVTVGSYMIVYDTVIELMPDEFFENGQPWRKGNNPMTAMDEYLKNNDEFVIDEMVTGKLLMTDAPRGYLKKIK